MATASPTNAAAAHNNGVFPLPLYTHSFFSPFPFPLVPTHVTCNKIQHKVLNFVLSNYMVVHIIVGSNIKYIPQSVWLLRRYRE